MRMKILIHKRICVICILATVLTACAGCGSEKKDIHTNTEAEQTTTEATSSEATTTKKAASTEVTTTKEIASSEATTTKEDMSSETTTKKETVSNEATTKIEEPTTLSDEQKLLAGFCDTGDAKLNEMCDDILVDILQPDMSERDKAYAIYKWVSKNVRYRGSSDTSDWIEGAKYSLTNRKGNCYAFYTASRALLARAGFETTGATSYSYDHYWNIVKVDGVWRHFDTTPGWGTERFLWTGTQIDNYVYYNDELGRNISYGWNPEGCPETE